MNRWLERPGRPRRPSFLWQAGLVLLPLVGLSILGLLAVRRDYVATEHDARRQATDIARVLAGGLGRTLFFELSHLEFVGNSWHGAGILGGRVPWPGTIPPAVLGADLYARRLTEWQAQYPDWRPEDVFPIEAALSMSHELISPRDYQESPSPSRWPVDLSSDQWIAWDTIARSHPNSADTALVTMTIEQLLTSELSVPAKSNVEFARLLSGLNRYQPVERVERLLHFARHCGMAETESGLSLGNVAVAHALREAAATGLTQPLFESLRTECYERPSLLIHRLLADADGIAAMQPVEIQEAVTELRRRWDARERLRALARRFAGALSGTGLVTTNLWLDYRANRWLAVTPGLRREETFEDGRGSLHTEEIFEARFYPKPMIERALDQAMSRMAVSLPDYLALGIAVAGETVLAVNPPSAQPQSLILARDSGPLRVPGRFGTPDEQAGERQLAPEVDSSPSLPGLEVEVHLANPQLLYVLARQRAWTMGGVTLAAVFAASIGLWAAWRSFQHQLRLNEMKTSFVSSSSHELRAPIASIRLMADSLERGRIADPERQHDYFRIIGQECRRLSALIENVLDFSRIDQGRKQYEFEPGDLAALVRQTLDLMQPYATARKVSLLAAEPSPAHTNQTIASHPQLLVDSRAIQQALVNLIDNAVKHSPPGGAVTVGWQSGPNPMNARLWVQDQGPGIPPQDRERIFEPFHRLGSELERETPGVGIGLSIVKHVVDAHRGRVWVECAPGQGSRFIIDLPVTSPSPTS